MVLRKPIAVAVHTETVVTHAMKQKDGVPICLCRSDEPRTQDDAVGGHNLYVAEFSVFVVRCSLGTVLGLGGQGTVARMQRHPAQTDTANTAVQINGRLN